VVDCGGVALELVWIPAGNFTMGESRDRDPDALSNEAPQQVSLSSGFWLTRHPVTVGQHHALGGGSSGGDQQPATSVTWMEARAFAIRLGARLSMVGDLPTEAQWEWAARGGDGRRFPWGDEPADAERACFIGALGVPDRYLPDLSAEDQEKVRAHGPAPIGGRPAGESPFGAQDMAGNVWEWCLDGHVEDRSALPAVDPVGDATDTAQRAIRGGAWDSPSIVLRSARRASDPWDNRSPNLGFRVALREV
jgi:eukaryotic-like serine/threonine-protein kinase